MWIYGGGFIFGDKSVLGTPDGLFARADEDVIYVCELFALARESESEADIIQVAMNYRLGLYGFLAGSSLQRQGGRANAGLYDQLLALHWVQDFIELFGGDPSKVTVFGESAGAASVLHQLTAFSALRYDRPPFAQAILQSPAFFPLADPVQLEETYERVLEKATNISGTQVSSLGDLRQVEPGVLAQVNGEIILASNYGQFSFGPVPDSRFAPALPGKLLARGEFYHDVKIMVGHNLNEGILFTPPFVQDAEGFIKYVHDVLPGADEEILKYIAQLYPVGSKYLRDPARDKIGALARMLGEVAVDCNTLFLARAYKNATYSYLFSVLPAFHGLDTFYTVSLISGFQLRIRDLKRIRNIMHAIHCFSFLFFLLSLAAYTIIKITDVKRPKVLSESSPKRSISDQSSSIEMAKIHHQFRQVRQPR